MVNRAQLTHARPQDDAALELIKEHKHQGVPVVSINNFADSWSGFRPDRLEELKGESA